MLLMTCACSNNCHCVTDVYNRIYLDGNMAHIFWYESNLLLDGCFCLFAVYRLFFVQFLVNLRMAAAL